MISMGVTSVIIISPLRVERCAIKFQNLIETDCIARTNVTSLTGRVQDEAATKLTDGLLYQVR